MTCLNFRMCSSTLCGWYVLRNDSQIFVIFVEEEIENFHIREQNKMLIEFKRDSPSKYGGAEGP